MAGNMDVSSEAKDYAARLIEAAASIRLPQLFREKHPDALYFLPNRNGVSIIALRTPTLTEDQFTKLLEYRFAQYLAVGFFDIGKIYESRMEHEPPSSVNSRDIHYIAAAAETGEILSYICLRAAPDSPPGITLRMKDRPLFPIEEYCGWGIFNRLSMLPDLPIHKVWELGRFVKNQRLHTFDELGARAPIEVCVALHHTLTGSLRMEVDAFIIGLEENVAKRNLDFFHIPTVVIHGTIPYIDENQFDLPHFQDSEIFACAALVSDMSQALNSRLPTIEGALEQPGKQGMLALLALKRDAAPLKSSLEPLEWCDALINATIRQQYVPMSIRRQMLDMGDRLRKFDLFIGLLPAEASILRSAMERIDVKVGDVIVRQWEPGDSLYLIETGQAEVRVGSATGNPVILNTLGPDEYFGEIGMLTGGERTADVIALTPMSLLRLAKDTYIQYLSQMVEVEQQLARTAVQRATNSIRRNQERIDK